MEEEAQYLEALPCLYRTVSRDGTAMLLFVLRTGDIHHVGDIVELHKALLPLQKRERNPEIFLDGTHCSAAEFLVGMDRAQ